MTTAPPCPLDDGNTYDIRSSTGHRLAQLMQWMRREVEWRMSAFGLTDAQWKPLWFIHCGRAGTAIELARELDMDAGSITRVLDRLEAKGLIERARSAADRRVVQLGMTAAGAAAASRIPQVLAEVNHEFQQGLDAAELQQLHVLLERMSLNGRALQARRSQP